MLPLRQTTRFGAFGATTLYLAIDRPHCIGRWRARLPANPGKFEVAEVGCRTRVVPAVVEDDPEGRELRLPLAIFRDATAIFAKLERRFGFFDEAGWLAIELATERRRSRAFDRYAAERVRAAAAMSSSKLAVSSQPMQASVIETP